ncbi:MAG: hypothetical protein AAF203_02680 [Pseudomonadota bacterium]
MKYKCHRQFLSDFIEENYDSRIQFLDSMGGLITKGALSHFLKKNARDEFLRAYRFKLNTWMGLLSHLKLKAKDYDYLVMLKMSEDVNLEFGQGSKELKSLNRICQNITKDPKMEISLSQAMEILPKKRKNRVFLTIFKELDYFMSSRGRLERTKKLQSLRDFFGQLSGEMNGSRNT